MVQTAPGDGVFLLDCSQMTVATSAFISNIASGISLDGTSDTTIAGNFVQGNDLEQIIIYGASYNNRIYNNIIYLSSQGVRDDGSGNFWDNDVSIGNWWSNYAGSGAYNIPGSAGSVDRYPRGGGSPTFIPITDSTATATSSIPPGGLVIATWVPMNLPTKAILVLSIALSYGALVILAIKKLR
jgi:hypothetical protein